jgi:hypothetical protein
LLRGLATGALEPSNAIDDHGHDLKNLKALHDARILIGNKEAE